VKNEDKYPFVECAPFADTIKGQGYSYQKEWHFVNTPYLDDSQDISKYNFQDYRAQNITVVISDIINWLSHNKESNFEDSVTYTATMKFFDQDQSEEAESFVLRLLIHFLGDIHQPCHSVERVDDAYPKGDRGCNSLHLKNKSGASNLHAVWDSLIYEETGREHLPLNNNDWEEYGQVAAKFSSAYPMDPSDFHDNDPDAWSAENVAVAKDIYEGVQENGSLSEEYITKAAKVAEARVAAGGRRLANAIKFIFGNSEAKAELFLQ